MLMLFLQSLEKTLRISFLRCRATCVKSVIVIQIALPGKKKILKNPQISKQVKMYNKLFSDLATEFDFLNLINPLQKGKDEYYIEDGYHLNENGAKIVYEKLDTILSERLFNIQ